MSSDDPFPSSEADPHEETSSRPQGKYERKKKRQPRKITPEYLRRAALYYIERYSATEASLRALLQRRIRNAAKIHETDPDVPQWVDDLVEDMKRLRFIDDAAFAHTRAVSLSRSGKSSRMIRQTLAQKGIRGDGATQALAAASDELGHEDNASMDRAAAYEFARRRRLGIFNPDEDKRLERKDKDMASLARRGFGYEVCRAVVEAFDEDDLRDRLRLDD